MSKFVVDIERLCSCISKIERCEWFARQEGATFASTVMIAATMFNNADSRCVYITTNRIGADMLVRDVAWLLQKWQTVDCIKQSTKSRLTTTTNNSSFTVYVLNNLQRVGEYMSWGNLDVMFIDVNTIPSHQEMCVLNEIIYRYQSTQTKIYYINTR